MAASDANAPDGRTFQPGDIVQHFKRELVDPSTSTYLYRIVGVAQDVPESGRHAVPAVGEVPRAPGELVEPVAARVGAVELVYAPAAVESGDVRLLRKDVEVRLYDVRDALGDLGRTARG